jgi:short-subunit dehydrogenase
MDIAGKIIVITGASSGIGERAAKQLAREGATVCLVARREEELQRVKDEIEADGAGQAWIYPTDLSNRDSLDATTQAILRDHPRIDVLVNNAGRSIRRSVKESLERYHDYERTMQLNYFAAVRLVLNFLPKFFEQRSGHIINVSSMSALMPTPYYSAYVGSKGALDAFSRAIGAELGDSGIAVTTINYPLVKTPMTAPTKIYDYMNLMDPEEAAGWILEAIRTRPAQMTSRLGRAWGLATTVLPGPTMIWTGRMFRYFGKRLQKRAEKSRQEQKNGAEG